MDRTHLRFSRTSNHAAALAWAARAVTSSRFAPESPLLLSVLHDGHQVQCRLLPIVASSTQSLDDASQPISWDSRGAVACTRMGVQKGADPFGFSPGKHSNLEI